MQVRAGKGAGESGCAGGKACVCGTHTQKVQVEKSPKLFTASPVPNLIGGQNEICLRHERQGATHNKWEDPQRESCHDDEPIQGMRKRQHGMMTRV